MPQGVPRRIPAGTPPRGPPAKIRRGIQRGDIPWRIQYRRTSSQQSPPNERPNEDTARAPQRCPKILRAPQFRGSTSGTTRFLLTNRAKNVVSTSGTNFGHHPFFFGHHHFRALNMLDKLLELFSSSGTTFVLRGSTSGTTSWPNPRRQLTKPTGAVERASGERERELATGRTIGWRRRRTNVQSGERVGGRAIERVGGQARERAPARKSAGARAGG